MMVMVIITILLQERAPGIHRQVRVFRSRVSFKIRKVLGIGIIISLENLHGCKHHRRISMGVNVSSGCNEGGEEIGDRELVRVRKMMMMFT
mmetsp:Transcript_31853/g.30364  ORF Transcript_31853/g.30364 Transcript_31853/m.30364 type:complete len:91 (-) Transcript_31853:94-366(-)